MAPSYPTNDARDGCLVNANSLSNCFLAGSSSECDYLFADILGSVPTKTALEGMSNILFIGSPFKIGPDVIRLDAIDVIDLRKVVRIGDKLQSYKSMDTNEFSITRIAGEPNFEVAPITHVGFHNSRRICGRYAGLANDSAPETSDSPKTANFVQLTELGDGDTPPFFDEHNMGPFARSAHIIASFCAHQGD